MEFLLFAALLGLIPAAIARSKGRSFAGFWIYGTLLLIVALPHAILAKPNIHKLDARRLSDGSHQRCPHCAEIIRRDAVACPHCGRDLAAGVSVQVEKPAPTGAPRTRTNTLVSWALTGGATAALIWAVFLSAPAPDSERAEARLSTAPSNARTMSVGVAEDTPVLADFVQVAYFKSDDRERLFAYQMPAGVTEALVREHAQQRYGTGTRFTGAVYYPHDAAAIPRITRADSRRAAWAQIADTRMSPPAFIYWRMSGRQNFYPCKAANMQRCREGPIVEELMLDVLNASAHEGR